METVELAGSASGFGAMSNEHFDEDEHSNAVDVQDSTAQLSAFMDPLDDPIGRSADGGATGLGTALPIHALEEEVRIAQSPAHGIFLFDDSLPESDADEEAVVVIPVDAPVEIISLGNGRIAADAAVGEASAASASPPAIDPDFDFGPNFRLHDKLANKHLSSETEVCADSYFDNHVANSFASC